MWNDDGFTLVELLITITVMAIMVAIAVPSFNNMLLNSRLTAMSDAFVNALNYARNAALAQNISMRACPIGAAGSTTCGSSWNKGWMVVSIPTTGTPLLLQVYNASMNDPTLSSVAGNAITISEVIFDSRGLSTTQANFTICDSRGATFARSVAVLPTGSVQSSNTTGTAVWDGSSLTCP